MSPTRCDMVSQVAHEEIGWAERCAFWLASSKPFGADTLNRRRNSQPLVLTGHGMHLRVHHGALVARNGFTHYPQEREEHRFFPGDRALPSRIVVIDGSGSLSFDVLSWLAEQRIPLIKLDWQGKVVTVIGASRAADPNRVSQQLRVLEEGRAIDIAITLVCQKIANSILSLKSAVGSSAARKVALDKLSHELKTIHARPPKSISALRGIEGRAAYPYFKAWQSLPLRWNGIGRHPIPDDWHWIGQRQSFTRKKGRNRHASHPVNALLNYGYAILESQIRIKIQAEGYDPRIGYLHISDGLRDAFVLDLMEPMRPVVDGKILEFVQAHTFHSADFAIRKDGVCRLNPAMAKYLTMMVAELPVRHFDQATLRTPSSNRKKLRNLASAREQSWPVQLFCS